MGIVTRIRRAITSVRYVLGALQTIRRLGSQRPPGRDRGWDIND